ncbi:wound-induced protein 1-like [Canna indica]|uniref:Wound-induced protein 1-like n=1 Tax=Canna indica TaxID=4628 RepID=A0AAQ3QNR0_9LILI|nr:wound-induced protein 1-like [Canna indica]
MHVIVRMIASSCWLIVPMASKAVVESLYEALSRGDAAAAAALMAEDVEWWFHGPRRCQYMRRLLTGEVAHRDFRFRPRRVAEVGRGWVVAEGWEGKHAYWVHAWAVEGGVITRFREYFNTAVTVQEVRPPAVSPENSHSSAAAVWQSEVRAHRGRSLPGLVLAI